MSTDLLTAAINADQYAARVETALDHSCAHEWLYTDEEHERLTMMHARATSASDAAWHAFDVSRMLPGNRVTLRDCGRRETLPGTITAIISDHAEPRRSIISVRLDNPNWYGARDLQCTADDPALSPAR